MSIDSDLFSSITSDSIRSLTLRFGLFIIFCFKEDFFVVAVALLNSMLIDHSMVHCISQYTLTLPLD